MWPVEFAEDALQDFELIYGYFTQAYQDFGDSADDAKKRAQDRIDEIYGSAISLGDVPFQGTLREDVLPGLRFVRNNNAVFWFVSEKERETVQVLAVFFGGQNHIRHMLVRLLSE